MNETSKKLIFIAAVLLSLTSYIDPPLALLLGIILAQTIGHPFQKYNHKATNWLLKASVVGLGFGMNLQQAWQAGKDGIAFTVFSIGITFLAGWLLGRWLDVERKTSFLISTGTAICGGSAIAAVSPIIRADEKQMSVSLGTVFILNSLALFLFPFIGHFFHMSQYQFGIWSAIAIHDTSSVVGASSAFGQEALHFATTVKLERALWIIPVSLLTVMFSKGESRKIRIPYFIGLYILAMAISTYFPAYAWEYSSIVMIAKKGLTVTLLLIGAGLSLETMKSVGTKPLVQGVLLWILISVLSITAALMTM
ncbi:MAG: YeiH family protein [Acidobacteriota bacterium]